MDPKVLVIMGMGGLMCFMFIIMVVIWLISQDDGEKETGTESATAGSGAAGAGAGAGGGGTATEDTSACPTGQIKKDGVCYQKCIGGEITVNCNNYLGLGNAHQWEHRDDCTKRFLRSSGSSTGFYQCMWNADHCTTKIGTEGSPIECIPEPDNDEHPCAEGVTWQADGGYFCECPSGTEYQEHADGGGRWRCCNNTTGPNGEACPTP